MKPEHKHAVRADRKEDNMELEQLVKLIQTVSDSNLTGFRYEAEGIKLSLKKETNKEICYTVQPESVGAALTAGAVGAYSIPSPTANAELTQASAADTPGSNGDASASAPKEGKIITSLLVGTFYAAPAEDADPYVKTGDRVKKGQTIGIIEAMKLMNEVECEYDGQIAEILVSNGEAVEYGQPLFRIID